MAAKKPIVFFDFDNTITTIDVLDDMLLRFSKDKAWMELEEKWKRGEIGSRECLKGQIEGIRLTKSLLDKYLKTIRIDAYFIKLIELLNDKKIKMMILSDNFDYILERILKNNSISGIDVYSNKLQIVKDRLLPTFPYSNEECGNCAHCKKTTLLKHRGKDAAAFYVGDGLSDLCAAKYADVVFAKDALREHLEKEKIDHMSIQGLKDVYNYFRGDRDESKTKIGQL